MVVVVAVEREREKKVQSTTNNIVSKLRVKFPHSWPFLMDFT